MEGSLQSRGPSRDGTASPETQETEETPDPDTTTDASDAQAKPDSSTTKDAGVDAEPVTTYSGEATYYDADGTGACGFPASTNYYVAAMNKAQYSKAVCGQCVHVKGPDGEVTVRIVDLCPGCSSGDLDLSMTAFKSIAQLSDGRVAIDWSFVPCP